MLSSQVASRFQGSSGPAVTASDRSSDEVKVVKSPIIKSPFHHTNPLYLWVGDKITNHNTRSE
jgi:hypothetical protein